MKNTFSYIAGFFLLLSPIAALAANSEVHITKDGNATVTSAKVMQLAGSTFYARLYWAESYVRLLIKTNGNTKFYRGTGEATTVSEVVPGNVLDLTGQLESGSESLVLVASTVKNSSVQKEQAAFSGKVANIDRSADTFTLNTGKQGTITVQASAKTVFVKGSRVLDLAHIAVGDTITKTSGEYDLSTKTLSAISVTAYLDMSRFKPQNFEGTLQSISGTTLPASLEVRIGGTSYTVNLSASASVMNKNRGAVQLARFVVGDTIRIYGSIQEADDPIINATIIRNLNL